MNEKIPVCTVIALVLLAAGFIAACQNQPRVSALTPVQIASTEINTQPAPTQEKTVTPNESPIIEPPEKSATPGEPPTSVVVPEPAKENSQQDLFAEIAKVLRHPRCLKCHVAGDTPKQGDDRHDHMPPVQLGPDGRGSSLTCNVCHQSSNGPVAPGAPDWHLAPVNMAWEGLSTGELCRAVTDTAKNGGCDLKALATHLTADPIVQWGWEAGGTRKPVPVSKSDFAKLVNAWVDGGGACIN